MSGAAVEPQNFLRTLESAGYQRRETAVLQPAAVFLALSGEEMRGDLLLTSDGARDFCLRPEFTIPLSLDYLASPAAGAPAAFCAQGPVFRQRRDAPAESLQAGLENFGRADREAADAEVLALALEAAGAIAGGWRIRIGDAGLLAAVLEKLDLPAVWLRRIRGGLAQNRALDEILAPAAPSQDHSGVLAALDGADKAGARALVEDLLKIAGIAALGGRTAGEIAERFLEQASLRASSGLDAPKRELLQKFFAIEDQPDAASARLKSLFSEARLDLSGDLERFDQRLNFLAARGVDLDATRFSASFARHLDYYTGFVFEAAQDGAAAPAIGGGRYDRLLARLGASAEIPAVGAAIFYDRLSGAQ